MSKVTYQNESPSGIRYGDEVTFRGETFMAYSNAEMDQWGEINVSDGSRWRSFSPADLVTISYVDDYDSQMIH